MMKKTFTLITAVLLILMSTGCTHRMTDFTVISTKNVPIGSRPASLKKADRRVKGKDTAHMILYFPIGMPNMKDAIDRAIESYPGAVGLVDGVLKHQSWWCLLYGQNSYIVEGTPIYEETEVEDFQANPRKTSASNPKQGDDSFAVLFYHEVKKGDTIAGVAEAYKVSVGDIIKWNGLNNSDLTPGSKLRIMVK